MKKFLLILIIVVITCVEEIVQKENELEVILFDLIESIDFQGQNTVD